LPNADNRVETSPDRRIAIPVGERQYHIGLGPGELAEYILLPGDPERHTVEWRTVSGIPLNDSHWARLVDLAGRLGVDVPE